MSKIAPQDYEKNTILALQTIIPECLFILAGRNGSEPKQGYCLVSIISETPQGMAQRTSTSKLDENNKAWQLVKRDYTINYTLSFKGVSKSQAEEWCRYLSLALDSDFGARSFIDNGMGVLDYRTFPRVLDMVNNVVTYISDTIDVDVLTNRFQWFPVEVIEEVNVVGDVGLDMNPDVEVNVKWQ